MSEFAFYKRANFWDIDSNGALHFTTNNTVNDYLSYTYPTDGQPEFTGNFFGNIWIRPAPSPNNDAKNIVSFNTNALRVTIDNNPGNTYVLIFAEPSGGTFTSISLPKGSQYIHIYFYMDFVTPANSFLYVNKILTNITNNAPITAPVTTILNCSLFRGSTFSNGTYLARIWVDSNPQINRTEWLNNLNKFTTLGNAFGPRDVGNFGEYIYGIPPEMLYARLNSEIKLDNRAADFTQVGTVHYVFDNTAPVFRVSA